MRGLTPCRLLVVLLPGDRARAKGAGEDGDDGRPSWRSTQREAIAGCGRPTLIRRQ